VNDTWLLSGRQWAEAGRSLLDDLSLTGGHTRRALRALSALVEVGAALAADAAVWCGHLSRTRLTGPVLIMILSPPLDPDVLQYRREQEPGVFT
jgi:hypothetical protein